MKKISTVCMGLVLMFALFNSSSAQDSTKTRYVLAKGTKLISGSVYFNGNRNSYGAESSQYITMNFAVRENSGYFVANNLVIGTSLGYNFDYSKNKQPDAINSFTINRHSFTPGIFLRYYKMFTPKFGFFGQFNGSYLIGFSREQTGNLPAITERKFWGVNFNLAPNLVYFLSKKITLDAGFGNMSFSYSKMEDAVEIRGGFNFNPSINLGLSVVLGKGLEPRRKN